MDTEKQAILLLKSLIFHYHGLDEDEAKMLKDTASKLDAHLELKWANEFIALDFLSAFERSREFLNEHIGTLPPNKKLSYLHGVWKDNNSKGYLTEMETTAMLKLAKEWDISSELMQKINS